ncbi:metalloenzyme [Peziza echinospora]|nr:metalloenzyme [Peziza echinospora]
MTGATNKAVLIVIDGWGVNPNPNDKGDAIAAATTPNMDHFRTLKDGYTELAASSLAVGLPQGLMGNSEVGHLNIGAGRVVWQDVVRIDHTLSQNGFPEVKNIKAALEHAQKTTKRLHLLGLVSDGGVHSHINHLYGLLRTVKEHYDIPEVYIHFFGDGRDTDPKSSARYLRDLEAEIKKIGTGKLATVVGRYYAMDRDKRWERVKVALDGIVNGVGEVVEPEKLVEAIEQKYTEGETDEFLKPLIVNGPEARVKDGDTLFFFNYRSDRVREITQLLGVDSSPLPDFKFPKNLNITTMTQYKADYPFNIAFPPQSMDDVLAEWLAKKGMKQCHVAETEKYAHVTFFFNGGVELQFENEVRDMVSSPRVATYDLQPEMSAQAVADKLAERIASNEFEFLMNNFAPPDMVGHTGVLPAAIRAVTATDAAIGTIYNACKQHGYILFITSDHGNAEEMLNEEGKPKTSHTTNKVPFVMVNAPKGWSIADVQGGQEAVLGDVAPTVLDAMGLERPEAMTGRSLLRRA